MTTSTSMALPMASLLTLLDMEEIPTDRDRTTVWLGEPQKVPEDRVFGGLQLAQAVVAAGRTTPDDQVLATLQADFIAGVPTGSRLRWEVDHVSDAPAFSTRRSTLVGGEGQELFTALTRWARVRHDLPSHLPSRPMQQSAPREDLPDLQERFGHDERIPLWWRIDRPVNVHHSTTPPYVEPSDVSDEQTSWLRASGDVPADPVVQAAVAAYATDMSILEPAFRATGTVRHAPGSRILSLTHTLTLHDIPDMGGCLRFDASLEALSHGRALGHGRLYDHTGRHLASTSQVGLVKFGAGFGAVDGSA
jgi:acyl-CoA thioesterase II